MAYSGVFVFGDSLVDSGNVLKLANFYGSLPFTDLPEGAPYASDGYFKGRFSDGYTFADLISNKLVGQTSDPIFPYNFRDPWLGLEIDPFASDPQGNHLNFSYGGAQILQGSEVVPDLDGQTDTFKDAVDGHPDPNALYLFTIGGNDVRSLAPADDDPASVVEAHAQLQEAAQKLLGELSGLIGRGVHNIVIVGIPDVGLIPRYDANGNLVLDGTEIARSEAATAYSAYLDNLIRTVVVPGLEQLGADVTYVPIADHVAASGAIEQGVLSLILPTLAALHGLTTGELTNNMLAHQDLVFFDQVHPTGQVHALVGSYMMATINGTAWVETLPMASAAVDYRAAGSVATVGETDVMTIALTAGTTYRFDLLGISSLGNFGDLADPLIRILSPNGVLLGFDDDSGAGFDSVLSFTAPTDGVYAIQLTAIGEVTGNYSFEAAVLAGNAANGGNSYVVNSASTLVLEHAGSPGQDTVSASVSYALAQGSEIEVLRTTNDRGKGAINLTGNEFAQTLIGNAGNNILDGRGGSDTYYGGAGTDRFVVGADTLTSPAATDHIMDYARGETVDLTAVLSVASGINVASGGYLRVTTGGLIQVDADGGGNQWATVATINSVKGSVTFTYLSGGKATNVNLDRVSASTSAMTMAVAAGVTALATPLAAAEPSIAGSGIAGNSSAQILATHIVDLSLAGPSGGPTIEGLILDSMPNIAPFGLLGSDQLHHFALDTVEPLFSAVSPLDRGIDIAVPSAMPSVAATVAIPAGLVAMAGALAIGDAIEHAPAAIDVEGLLATLSVPEVNPALPFGDLAHLAPVIDGIALSGLAAQPIDPGMVVDATASV